MDYRPNAGICLINQEGHIFLALRAGYADAAGNWQMPQGGVDAGEGPLTAAKRELYEETAIPESDIQLISEAPEWMTYDFPPETQRKFNSLGQKQKWFCFRYIGGGKIDLTQAEDQEFDAWKWATPEETLSQVVDFKKDIYQQVLALFQKHIS